MTRQQVILWACAYLIELVAVIYFTRATALRIIGALAGGAAAGLFAMGAIALCEALGWWWIPFASTPYFLPLFYLGLLISLTPIYLVTWRVARRFGWRGLAMCLCVVAVIGPPGLPNRLNVPEVDGVRTGRCTDPCGRRDLCRYGGAGAHRDAPDRRPRQRRPIGATSHESRLKQETKEQTVC